MIELNLLPKELRKKVKPSIQIPNIPVLPVAVGVLAILITINTLLGFWAMYSRNKLNRLNKKWDLMQPEREKTGRITTEIVALEKKVSAIRKIAKPDLEWTRLLMGLNQSVIPNIWLSNFGLKTDIRRDKRLQTGKEVSDFLEIEGYALGESEKATLLTAKFINNLEENKNFSEYFETIELQNISKRVIEGKEAMLFKLDCRFKDKGNK